MNLIGSDTNTKNMTIKKSNTYTFKQTPIPTQQPVIFTCASNTPNNGFNRTNSEICYSTHSPQQSHPLYHRVTLPYTSISRK